MKTQNLIAFILLTGLSLIMNGTFTVSAQTEWTKYSGNPVLTKSDSLFDWDMFVVGDPSVIKDGDTLKMWFTGSGPIINYTTTDTTAAIKPRIGYAYSLDGIHWTKYSGNPVMLPTPGEWDSLAIETVTVLKDTSVSEDERYRMWYVGSGDQVNGLYQIGYAFSPDGIHWTKHSNNPVLTTGPDASWENASLEGPTVIKEGDTLRMWYAALDTISDGQSTDYFSNIGYAWSMDGINWIKYPYNPVLIVGNWGSWEAAVIQDPFVTKIDNIYHMWYSGFPEWLENNDVMPGLFQIGYAYSMNGINWIKDENNPVIQRGELDDWDSAVAGFPSIIVDGDSLYMWYTGLNEVPLPEWPEPFYWDIGYAVSSLNITNVTDSQNQIPNNFNLFQNYPNPFNPTTTIQYGIPHSSHVNLSIYDLMGRKVATLIDKQQPRGWHTLQWDGVSNKGQSVSSGVYIVRLQAGDFVDNKKIILVK